VLEPYKLDAGFMLKIKPYLISNPFYLLQSHLEILLPSIHIIAKKLGLLP